jgi:hypothetical protein
MKSNLEMNRLYTLAFAGTRVELGCFLRKVHNTTERVHNTTERVHNTTQE